MAKCPHCEGGWIVHDEDGKQIREGCYHCGNTGTISQEQLRCDRIESAACKVATRMVDYMRKLANTNPHGEGWAFHAAENMMFEHEYTLLHVTAATQRVMDTFKHVENEHPRVLDALVEILLNEPPKTDRWFRERWNTHATHMEMCDQPTRIEPQREDIPF